MYKQMKAMDELNGNFNP